MKATIILLSGEQLSLREWQSMYNLPIGSNRVGRFFSIGEKSFKDGLIINEGVIRLLDVIRVLWGKPITINSLDRTEAEQRRLKAQGYRTAKYSPHVFKLAADIDTKSEDETLDLLDVIDEAEEILGYTIRKGWEDYLDAGQTFVHVDICPMMYAKNKAWHNKKHPKAWELKTEW